MRLTLLLAARGGQGRTTLAANLAVALARKGGSRVLLVDADWLSGGALPCSLDLENEAQAAVAAGRDLATCWRDPERLGESAVAHASGVRLLAAGPADGKVPAGPTAKQVVGLVLEASRSFDHVVVDLTYPALTPGVLALVDYASPVLVVTNPDLMALQATRGLLDGLKAQRVPSDKVQVVLNRVGLTEDVTPEDVAEHLGRAPLASLPFHPPTVTAVNRGVPLFAQAPTNPFAARIGQLATRLASGPATAVGQTSQAILAREPAAEPEAAAAPERSTAPAAASGRPPAGGHEPEPSATTVTALVPQEAAEPEAFGTLKPRVHQGLVQELKGLDLSLSRLSDAGYRKDLRARVVDAVAKVLEAVLEEVDDASLTRAERLRLIDEVTDEAIGYGPLEKYLADPAVTEIMVNGPGRIYVEKRGKLSQAPLRFTDEAQLRVVIDRIVAPLGRRVDESSPMCDARLPDGSRVNVVIPPLSLTGSTLTIRKFPSSRLGVEHLLHFGSLSPDMAAFLKACVQARLNVFISGGTGSGKTTLLNVLSGFIPTGERIVTVEDAAELRLNQDHVVSLEARPPNLEGKGAITIRDLVRNALRMRPDRIIVGEVRGGEALDMLQAMNTGHDGSLATGHANSPRDALARLETMALMAGVELPMRAIREQIASAIHLIVQQNRLPDGSRKIVRVTEITGMEGELITMQDLFVFEQQGLDAQGRVRGAYRSTGLRPLAAERFAQAGIVPAPDAGPAR